MRKVSLQPRLGDGRGSFCAPAAEYLVDVDSYNHTTTKVYAGGQVVAMTTLVYLDGTFQAYGGYRVTFLQAIAIPHGEGALPVSGYPDYIGATAGGYGEVQSIRMEITPEHGTLAVLAVGGLLAIVRGRKR